ncbi:hypothetical protein UCDDA912_g10296 [Diaporthe ampelina]|uniref:Uncharacterized protein n=1 Tax=Diaporthe ampelina TaxID=1214573 RepID=A0A0G2HNF4_9PEZI|nr:hypothetical protein UCDDA912_g10296 [Diaporthe ampelina]
MIKQNTTTINIYINNNTKSKTVQLNAAHVLSPSEWQRKRKRKRKRRWQALSSAAVPAWPAVAATALSDAMSAANARSRSRGGPGQQQGVSSRATAAPTTNTPSDMGHEEEDDDDDDNNIDNIDDDNDDNEDKDKDGDGDALITCRRLMALLSKALAFVTRQWLAFISRHPGWVGIALAALAAWVVLPGWARSLVKGLVGLVLAGLGILPWSHALLVTSTTTTTTAGSSSSSSSPYPSSWSTVTTTVTTTSTTSVMAGPSTGCPPVSLAPLPGLACTAAALSLSSSSSSSSSSSWSLAGTSHGGRGGPWCSPALFLGGTSQAALELVRLDGTFADLVASQLAGLLASLDAHLLLVSRVEQYHSLVLAHHQLQLQLQLQQPTTATTTTPPPPPPPSPPPSSSPPGGQVAFCQHLYDLVREHKHDGAAIAATAEANPPVHLGNILAAAHRNLSVALALPTAADDDDDNHHSRTTRTTDGPLAQLRTRVSAMSKWLARAGHDHEHGHDLYLGWALQQVDESLQARAAVLEAAARSLKRLEMGLEGLREQWEAAVGRMDGDGDGTGQGQIDRVRRVAAEAAEVVQRVTEEW